MGLVEDGRAGDNLVKLHFSLSQNKLECWSLAIILRLV
jgi:hypothetical protein